MAKLTELKTQRVNANRHTQRGIGALEHSVQQDGWIGAITVAADGETFDGSARLEVGASTGFEDVIVVESDGTKPIVVKRTDIPSADDPRAVRLGIAANRVAQLDLDWSPDVLASLSDEGVLDGLFNENEIDRLLENINDIDPAELWKGMPEFEQEDLGAWKSITVHFANQDDYLAFLGLVGQPPTLKMRSIWYPNLPNGSYIPNECVDEP